ncbi:hypothetical protein, partial [Streptomyces xantholiticus]|uniref:hypothetical protein n=1 Tax=Streptomyces xantholiticus TaxID=68285 RepID=UPI001E3CA7CC
MRKGTAPEQAPHRAAHLTNRLQQWRGIATRYEKTALELPPDPADGGLRQTTVLGHRLAGPVGGVLRDF